jgi:pimeloyl-ACP methyl ester carboxylesterase
VDDLEALAQHLGLERFHLVGTAAGGIIAVDYTLSLSAARAQPGGREQHRRRAGRGLRRHVAPPAPVAGVQCAADRGARARPSYRAANPEGTKRWSELAKHVASQPSKNRITWAALETIKAPTLLITGDADLYTPPSVLRMFAERFPNCESLVIPNAATRRSGKQPEAFNRAVLDFLQKH